MALALVEGGTAPGFLKVGLYGDAGCGKTFTAAKLLAQFIAEYEPKRRIAFFDTENGAGFVRELVKKITGKYPLVVVATSFRELKEFLPLCAKEGHVALVDSITHPWQKLVDDAMEAKRARVAGAGGNPETARMAVYDWILPKALWKEGVLDPIKYLPMHLVYCGRTADVWEMVKDDTGKEELQKTGSRMGVEKNVAYEPNLLVEMRRVPNPAFGQPKAPTEHVRWLHEAAVVKDRADTMNGKAAVDPDIEFFRPHLDFLKGGGQAVPPSVKSEFGNGSGPNWETIKRERAGLLEAIQDDLVLAWPGQAAADKKQKIAALRYGFTDDVSWAALTDDEKRYPADGLRAGRARIQEYITKHQGADNAANSK